MPEWEDQVMAEGGEQQQGRAARDKPGASEQAGVLNLRSAHAAELTAEDVPPRRVGALWPESDVTPPKSEDAVTDPEKPAS